MGGGEIWTHIFYPPPFWEVLKQLKFWKLVIELNLINMIEKHLKRTLNTKDKHILKIEQVTAILIGPRLKFSNLVILLIFWDIGLIFCMWSYHNFYRFENPPPSLVLMSVLSAMVSCSSVFMTAHWHSRVLMSTYEQPWALMNMVPWCKENSWAPERMHEHGHMAPWHRKHSLVLKPSSHYATMPINAS